MHSRRVGAEHFACASITVMNAKGGVGKSTLVLTLAETLSAHHDMRVLVIDSDAHASLSSMLLPNWLATMQAKGRPSSTTSSRRC